MHELNNDNNDNNNTETQERTVDTVLELEASALTSSDVKKLLEALLNFNLTDALKLDENAKYRELEFFTSNTASSTDTIFTKLNKTLTTMGELSLKSILLKPLTTPTILTNRSEIIAFWRSNPKMLEDVRSHLAELGNLETEFMWFFKERTPEMNKVLEIVYFQSFWNSFLNNIDWFMKYYYYFIILVYPLYGAIMPLFFLIVPYIAVRYMYGYWIPIDMYLILIKTMFFAGGNIFSMFGNIYSNMSGGGNQSIMSMILNSGIIKLVYYGFVIGGYIYGIYSAAMVSVSYHKIIAFIHKKLYSLSAFVCKVKAIWDKYKFFGCIELEERMHTLNFPDELDELWNPIFADEHHWYTDKGAVLALYWKLKDTCKTIMTPLLEYIGLLDAWSSVALLELNIPHFKWQSKAPLVNIEGFWNPMIAKDSSITNDLKCEAQNVIITSPNASGKSTCMKAIIECLLLAQTICLTPAKTCELTPFKYIATYLNIPDTQGKESLFQAEMARCYKQIEDLKGLNIDEYAFTIMDEIFTSTNHLEGIAGTYGVMRKMANFKNSICLITTHFDVIKKAFSKDARFKNYHLPIIIKKCYGNGDGDGYDDIIKTYKLVAGYSKHQKIALDLLKCRGFDKDILDDAQRMFKVLTSKKRKVETEVESKVETEVETEVESKVETEVESKVETEVETEVESKVETEVETEVESKVETEVKAFVI
jgi:hypothetical protein